MALNLKTKLQLLILLDRYIYLRQKTMQLITVSLILKKKKKKKKITVSLKDAYI